MNATIILFIAFLATALGQQDGTLALFRAGQSSTSYSSGIAQVYYNDKWQGVCMDSSFGSDEADVICRQAGYNGALNYTTAREETFGFINEVTIVNTTCLNSYYQVLFQCDFDWGSCDVNDAVTVQCSSSRVWDSKYIGQLRLTGGTYTNEGTVEVYCVSRWGTVCSFGFDSSEAKVVCKQLGYDSASYSSVSRNLNTPVWLKNVNCISSYSCLTYCKSCPVNNSIILCSGSQVAYVSCGSSPTTDNDVTASSCDFTAVGTIVAIVVGVLMACCCIVVIAVAGSSIFCCGWKNPKFRHRFF